jgi:phage tail sheath protein FI
MATYLHPGVYVEEIPGGARPIEAVGTSVAAFLAAARRGPTGEPVLIHSLDEYTATFGPIASTDDALGLAISAFYSNGGKDAYIVRVAKTDPPAAVSATTLVGADSGGEPVLKVSASSVGVWGDDLRVRVVRDADPLLFTLDVGTQDEKGFVPLEQFPRLVMDARSQRYVLTQVNASSTLVRVALQAKADPAAAGTAVQRGLLTGGQLTGGATLFTGNTGISDGMTMRLNLDGLGVRRITLGSKSSLALEGTDNAADGQKVAAAIQTAVKALAPTTPTFRDFTCTYNDRKFVLTSGASSTSSSVTVVDGDLTQFLKLDAAGSPASVHGSAKVVPQASTGDDKDKGRPLTDGHDEAPERADYQKVLTALVKVPDVNIIILPGQQFGAGFGTSVIEDVVAHCELMKNRMVIFDLPRGSTLEQASDVTELNLPTQTYAVLYHPWLAVPNPFFDPDLHPNVEPTVLVAPSAFVAGIWSRIDAKRGVWKAPAGVETALLGTAGLESIVGDGEQDQLNPLGVNCIRQQPGFGRVLWGARTLATRAAPEWRYVPVRRTAIFLEQSIYNGIQWAVFEPNDHQLWSTLRTTIESFLDGMFRSNAFQGQKASDAYFVRCGLGDTMTQADIDRGQVIVIVGFAPLKPAEFVIVRIQQKAGQQ